MLRPGSGSSKRTFARGGLTSIKDWIRLQRTFPQGYDGTVQHGGYVCGLDVSHEHTEGEAYTYPFSLRSGHRSWMALWNFRTDWDS